MIAIGGGSAMDAAKAAAMMAGQDRPILEFEDLGDNWRRVAAVPVQRHPGAIRLRCDRQHLDAPLGRVMLCQLSGVGTGRAGQGGASS
ncbi:hypothetical protein P775_28465 [Puniceibacterium antarcticum]|uniref:Uncharacterized protein n=1 Tax=Puniceibacterium antarcticum TaxID=1206336 RepID=A0A2G8QT38_9RHOB|nr:hypothetical protein P775_28465 [Puniceibacterium antarcticum]